MIYLKKKEKKSDLDSLRNEYKRGLEKIRKKSLPMDGDLNQDPYGPWSATLLALPLRLVLVSCNIIPM